MIRVTAQFRGGSTRCMALDVLEHVPAADGHHDNARTARTARGCDRRSSGCRRWKASSTRVDRAAPSTSIASRLVGSRLAGADTALFRQRIRVRHERRSSPRRRLQRGNRGFAASPGINAVSTHALEPAWACTTGGGTTCGRAQTPNIIK
jgi:hypothetical protein